MNDTQIETLLRYAPRPTPPTGLKQRLLTNLPRLQRRNESFHVPDAPSFWRRWFPALSFGVLLLGCLIAIAVQTSQFLALKHQNQALLGATADLDQLREENAALQSARSQPGALNQALKEHEELVSLRSEVEKLREQANELAALRAENQRLKAERAAAQAGVVPEEDVFMKAKEKADRTVCVNNLKQICLAARIYANDHNDTLPLDIESMKHELNTPRFLTCPSDRARQAARSWEDFDGSSLSYEFLAPGIKDSEDPHTVMFRCRIHHNVGLLDGSVQQLRDESQLINIDGRVKLAR